MNGTFVLCGRDAWFLVVPRTSILGIDRSGMGLLDGRRLGRALGAVTSICLYVVFIFSLFFAWWFVSRWYALCH